MTLHKDLTGADLHEPKGAASAPNGTVYHANGSGSGAWRKSNTADLDTTNMPGLTTFTDNIQVTNINTTRTAYFVLGQAGSLIRIRGVIDGPVTTDTTLQFFKNGITAIGSVVITSAGSTAGGTLSFDVTPSIAFAPGDLITVVPNGTGTGITSLNLHLLFNF